MKKLTVLLIAAVMMLCACFGNAEKEITEYMRVINCEEWVSLRAKPDTDSRRIAKVNLGVTVSGCEKYNAKWVKCDFDGKTGYILLKYLESVVPEEDGPVTLPEVQSGNEEHTEPAPGAGETVEPEGEEPSGEQENAGQDSVFATTRSYHAFITYEDMSAEGSLFFEQDDYRIFTARNYDFGGETLKVACYGIGNTPLWGYVTSVEYMTELQQTDCFIGGTQQEPCVMVYNSELGLTRINIPTGEDVWTLSADTVRLGASICHYTEEDGTMYIAGYYGPDPVCISANGELQWESDAENEEIYWPYAIRKTEEGLTVDYDSGDEQNRWEVVYDSDGYKKDSRLIKRNE